MKWKKNIICGASWPLRVAMYHYEIMRKSIDPSIVYHLIFLSLPMYSSMMSR